MDRTPSESVTLQDTAASDEFEHRASKWREHIKPDVNGSAFNQVPNQTPDGVVPAPHLTLYFSGSAHHESLAAADAVSFALEF